MAQKAVQGSGLKLKTLRKPITVFTAKSGEAGRMTAEAVITGDIHITLNTGEETTILAEKVFVSNELRDDEALLGEATLLKIGVDVVELLRSKCTVPAATARRTEAAAAGSSGSEPDSDSECDEMMWVNRIMMREEEKQMPPDVDRHEPEKVQTALDTALDKAQLAGLSKQAVDKLHEHVSTTSADAFRLVLSNNPPARVAPIKVHVDADVFATKQGRRRYSKADSVFMAAMMRNLEDFGYV